MGAVLFERAQRHRQDAAPPGRLHLGPGGAGELHDLRCGPASGSERAWARAAAPRRGRPSSDRGPTRGRPCRAASAASPCPCTHSGSGPSSGRPVKNLAAMHPPRQASNEPQEAQAPALWGSRSERKSADSRQTTGKPPEPRTLPARNWRSMTKGQAYTSPTGSMRQTTRPAPQRFNPSSGSPRAERWKKESPVSTPGRSSSQWYSVRCCAAVGCSASQVSTARPEGRSRVSRSWAP